MLRKVVKIDGPVAGTLFVTAKTPYEVFCNGRSMGQGDQQTGVQGIDVSDALRQGDNVIAVQARRETSEAPGIAVRFQYNTAQTRQSIETDGTWLAARRALPLWKTHLYSDRNWDEATLVKALPAAPSSLPSDSDLPVPSMLSGQTARPATGATAKRDDATSAATQGVLITQGDAAEAPDQAISNSLVDSPSPLQPANESQSQETVDRMVASDPAVPEAVKPVPSIDQSPADPQLVANATQKIYPSTTATSLAQTADTDGQMVEPAPSHLTPEFPAAGDSGQGTEGSEMPAAIAQAPYHAPDLPVADNAVVPSQTAVPATDEIAATAFTEDTPPNAALANNATADDDSIRLRVPENFVVEPIASSDIGSLIAIEFDEFGRLIASREQGGLVRVDLTVPVDDPRRVTEICSEISAVQGILPLNGTLYVTGVGPEGLGLYQLTDTDGDFLYETVTKFCGFTGEPGEHGPHAINLGSDRMLYVLLGNHSQIEGELSDSSLIRNFYEGDLLPRYEDPSGHAVGIKAPGGTLVRISLDGQQKEVVAAGLRNAYDFAFNDVGEIFLHDSDMESDEGTSWYRPTQLHQVIGGGDYGWRSGWAKWRSYYPDAIPPIARTGRSSPSGCAYYQHVRFPAEYRNTLFLADWSNGRIVSAKLERDGARYQAKLSTFMEGRPLNVTDLSVGPEDGALYVALGGRGSTGGIYRVRWNGAVSPELVNYSNPWEEVIRTPLFYSAAARQRIATLKQNLNDSWDKTMRSIVTSEKNVDAYRLRGLDVLQWFGPTPDIALLRQLSTTASIAVRAKIATILGTHDDPEAIQILMGMLQDTSPLVQRHVCESLIRQNAEMPVEKVVALMDSPDRTVAYVAGRLLEKQPVEAWKDFVGEPQTIDRFVRLSLALMAVEPGLANSYNVLVGINRQLDQTPTDQQQLDLLRVTQLALATGNVNPEKIPAFVQRIADQFPCTDDRINRELIYLLSYLKPEGLDAKYQAYLGDASIAFVDRWHLAMHIQLAGEHLSDETRGQLIQFLEQARTQDAGGSYAHYVMQATRDLAATLPESSAEQWIQQGAQFPDAALISLGNLPKPITTKAVSMLGTLDEQLAQASDPASRDLRLGIVAVLGEAMASERSEVQIDAAKILESIWKKDPNRRQWVAVALSQCPLEPTADAQAEAEDEPDGSAALRLASQARTQLRPAEPAPVTAERFFSILVDSLPYLTGDSAGEVLVRLEQLDGNSRNPAHLRQIILLGAKHPSVIPAADRLLKKWNEELPEGLTQPQTSMANWQSWFQQRFPDQLPAVVPKTGDAGKWTISEIEKQLELLKGDVLRGQQIYTDARCAACHKAGDLGSSVGPDLNIVTGRYTRREILEAIVHPSQVISDQYRSSVIQTDDGKVRTGIVSQLSGGRIAILDSDGNRTVIPKIDIVEVKPSDQSIMPPQLLEPFNAQQVVDLIHFLESENRPSVADAGQNPTQAR